MVQKLRDRILAGPGATRPLDEEELLALARGVDLETLDLADHCAFDRACYARNTVLLNDHLELVVICWLPGQESAVHDHGESRCLYLVVDGEMEEDRFELRADEPVPTDVVTYKRGDITLATGAEIHRIANRGDRNLTTVHVYSPPLAGTRMFTAIPRNG